MKLIFLNRYFYPDHSATSQMLSDLAFGLAKSAPFKVHIITSRQCYDDADAGLSSLETVDDVVVHRVWTSQFGRGNLLGRAVDYLSFYASAAWKLWRLAKRHDVIIAKTDPPLLSVIVAPIARLKRARLINWLQDLYPEVAQALGIGRGGLARRAINLLRIMRNRSLRFAYTNIVLGEVMAEKLREQGVSSAQIRIIANWSDGNQTKPVSRDQNSLRQDWRLDDKFVVGYSGNFGRTHDFDTVLEAMKILSATASAANICFLFIGGGAQHEKLKQAARQNNLKNIQLRPYQPRDQLSQSLSVADIHLVSLLPEFEGLIVPSKFYGIAAVGRATLYIGSPQGEIPLLLEAHQCGLVVQPGEGQELAGQILKLSRDPLFCQQMGQRARALLEQRFEKEIAIESWTEMLNELHQHAATKNRPG